MTPSPFLDPSPDVYLAKALVDRFGRVVAHRVVDDLIANLTTIELAALAAHWPMWARPKQLPPATDWISFGELAARGWGKSAANARYLIGEMQVGRVKAIGGAAQNDLKTRDAQFFPLIFASPPWFRPEWEVSTLSIRWPNGASYQGFTPEAPEPIRSPNFDMVWLSELQSWPAATRDEAYANFLFACRIGLARRIWDATPKRGHPIIKKLLERAEKDPRHIVRRGTMYENPHLTKTAVEELEAEYGGTMKGREELLGEMLSESDRALVKQEWIERSRRVAPSRIVRRVIAIDPAVTNRRGNDRTGIVDDALDDTGQVYVMGDYSGRHAAHEWPAIVLDKYVAGDCDCVVVETNKGGDLVTQNLRAVASARGMIVVVLGKDEPPRRQRGAVFVREVHARGEKSDRAQPLATAYERGRISHVIGVDLTTLEETLTTWEPEAGQRSPDALDAHTHGVGELLGLLATRVDHSAGFVGITAVADAVTRGAPSTSGIDIQALLRGGRHGGGGRI